MLLLLTGQYIERNAVAAGAYGLCLIQDREAYTRPQDETLRGKARPTGVVRLKARGGRDRLGA